MTLLHAVDGPAQFVFTRLLTIHDEPFGEIDEVRRRVPSRPVAGGPERGVDHRRYGTLTVRSGDMHGTEGVFRMAESLENRADVLEAELDPEVLEAEEVFEWRRHESSNTEFTEQTRSTTEVHGRNS